MQGCMAETGASISGVTESTLKTIAKSCLQFLGYENLKEKQLKAVISFMEGNDTFVALPTSHYTKNNDRSIQQHL